MKSHLTSKQTFLRVLEAALILILALAWSAGHAAPDDSPFRTRPGEQDFRTGLSGPKGNEDSDPLDVVAQMGIPTYAGTGCPQGSIATVLSSDGRTLSMIYDSFAVRAGMGAGKRNQMSCQLRIPITVPAGYKMEATRIDYRGFANAPNRDSWAMLQASHEIYGSGRPKNGRAYGSCGRNQDNCGQMGRPLPPPPRGGGVNMGAGMGREGRELGQQLLRRSAFRGPFSDTYLVSSMVPAGGQSACGEDVTLVVTNIATVVSGGGADTMMTVDTIDSQTDTIKYHLRWKRCR